MALRTFRDILVVDGSALAQNMYQLLFSAQNRFRVLFAQEYETLFKRSKRLRPDLLIVNSNSLGREVKLEFPSPTILIISRDRFDLKEKSAGLNDVVVIEKPFYPYDLMSVANRLIAGNRARMDKIRLRVHRSKSAFQKRTKKAKK
jgi:hypothetical protein